MATHHRRGPWSQAEDSYLMSLVQNQGALNWVRIATILGSRTPKQCRERYHQNLKPSLNHDPITLEEGFQIERLVREIGKRWAEIARRLHGRSDNAVKNWWNGSQNRRKRMDRRKASHISYDERADMLPLDMSKLSIPRTLPMPPMPPVRPHPAPLLSSSLHDGLYSVETPLSSPSAYSPDSELAPSLMSDYGSHYSTSPQCYDVRSPELELPPLKMPNSEGPGYSPRSSVSPTDTKNTKLPSFSALLTSRSPHYPRAPEAPPYVMSPEIIKAELPQRRYPPVSDDYFPKSHLPTAPSSPVVQSNLQQLRPLNMEQRDTTKVNVSDLVD